MISKFSIHQDFYQIKNNIQLIEKDLVIVITKKTKHKLISMLNKQFNLKVFNLKNRKNYCISRKKINNINYKINI